MEDQVTISKEEYKRLKDDSLKLRCLYAAGVDNWEGYGLAIDDYCQYGDEEID